MLTHRHLRNAPIVEAVVDLQAKLPITDVSTLDSMYSLVKGDYPKREELRTWESRFEIRDGKPVEPRREYKGIEGYRYISSDGKQVIQARLDRLAFSRLKPYDNWQHLRDNASRHWDQYVAVSSPEFITRVALRYINRLEIRLPIRDLGEWLATPPTVPKNLPQEVGTFLTRIAIHKDPVTGAVITQALETLKKDMISIILDIDVFTQRRFEIGAKEIWDTLEDLHVFKNDVFFSSVTEKTLELYE